MQNKAAVARLMLHLELKHELLLSSWLHTVQNADVLHGSGRHADYCIALSVWRDNPTGFVQIMHILYMQIMQRDWLFQMAVAGLHVQRHQPRVGYTAHISCYTVHLYVSALS